MSTVYCDHCSQVYFQGYISHGNEASTQVDIEYADFTLYKFSTNIGHLGRFSVKLFTCASLTIMTKW